MTLRLRQLCLVARELDPVVNALSDVFGVTVCHRDPEVGQFGLHNALLPFGDSFVEVVAPLREGTTAGRYLERRRGDGGYMVILDSDGLDPWRAHVADIGVRIAAPLQLGDYEGMQLHPRDTGGALLEINHTLGGESITGAYWPAGPHWTSFVRRERVQGVIGATLQASEPAALAQRWGQILKRPVSQIDGDASLQVDNATLRFTHDTDGRGEGLGGIELQVVDAVAIVQSARSLGHAVDVAGRYPVVAVGGVRFTLSTAPFAAALAATASTGA
jgi:hypothetical protein